jgi:AI-2 transport protein TqsA
MASRELLTHPARILVLAAAAVIVLGGMRVAGPILNPFLFSFVFTIIAIPVLRFLERKGLSTILAVLVIVAGAAGLIVILIAILSLSLPELEGELPTYQNILKTQVDQLEMLLASVGITLPEVAIGDVIEVSSLIPTLATVVGDLIQLFFDFLLILIVTVFMLLEVSHVRQWMQRDEGPGNQFFRQFLQFNNDLIDYFIIRVKVNLITGGATAVLLIILGIKSPLLWGVVVFIMSFIPYLGLTIASIPPAALGWLQHGLWGAAIVFIGIGVINLVAENIIFPQMAAKSLGLSPLVVILSVFFWAWVLGATGMFLGVPLTLMIKYLLEGFEETRWIGEMMGAPPLTHSFIFIRL